MVQLLHNIVVFVSGAVLMALEIVGSRVLAPYFGSSIFVWGSLISVVMAALSIGYYWGGWMSAREPSYGKLLTLLVIPGILIFFLPFVYPSVNEWIASHDFGTRLNPLDRLQRAVSFAGSFPRYDLALCNPSRGHQSFISVGSTAGTLYAISTCGSIFGTLLTAFYLIPVLGVSNIIHALGITLVCLSLVVVPLLRLQRISLGAGRCRGIGPLGFGQYVGADCLGEDDLAKRHFLSPHPHRRGRRSALHVLRSHSAERDDFEGSRRA